MHGEYALRAHLAQRMRRHGMGEHAIHQPASARFHRQKHSWISATCPHRIDDRAGGENHPLAGVEVGCSYAKGNVKVRARKGIMRSLEAKPRRDSVQRAKVVKRTLWASSSSSLIVSPLQYAAPISAPTLVPATIRMGMPSSSRTLRTPMWAMPRAKPPPSARPMAGGRVVWVGIELPDSSRPKACTDRITLPKRFMATHL